VSLIFKGITASDLFGEYKSLGLNIRGARKIQGAVLRKGEVPSYLADVSYKVLDRIKSEVRIPNLRIAEKIVSSLDGFAKYAFQSDDGSEFEAVRIPIMHRQEDKKYVVCVSSQIGCALGCAFCETGKMGFTRNLEAWEIVDQVIRIRSDSEYPVRGVVFMGMGEPFLNYENVMQAARIMCEPCGLAISGKAITISTAGIVPGIRKLIEEKVQYRLVVSLTSCDHETRERFMPVERLHPLPELMQALREFHAATRERIILAWTMIRGVNTSRVDVDALARLTEGLPVRIDLIDVNDPDGSFTPPTKEELSEFRGNLKERLGMPFARRYSGGFDIRAACGMLARPHRIGG
jgi:23S rRNA (adenine2503-C2)-methyltransferase